MSGISHGAKVVAMTLTGIQTCFFMYHMNSYASNPVMLRTPKPMIMRDIFLTKSSSLFPNPLSCVYVTSPWDAFVNCTVAWSVVAPLTHVIGVRNTLAAYIGCGFFSSFAYLFQVQVNPSKRNTQYDCACTSNGAFAGLCVLAMALPKCYIPLSKNSSAKPLAALYLAKCVYDDYVSPRLYPPQKGEILVTNTGFVGAVFFALMFSSLRLRTKVDFGQMQKFYHNLKK